MAADLDAVIDGIEKRYVDSAFEAEFMQESTLKEMDITDTATGRIYVEHPGKMRWEYLKPEKQIIITDSRKLWIYRPLDNQVMVGAAPSYFGDGKGASFLSDMSLVRQNFLITLEPADATSFYRLRLIPVKKDIDLTEIYLSVARKTYDIVTVTTFNAFGDRTRIHFKRFHFSKDLDDALFSLEIPKGVDVLQLDK